MSGFRLRGTNINYVAGYTTHAWEKWAHDFSDKADRTSDGAQGHLWFIDPGTGMMWRGWFFPHYLFHQGGEFYDASGDCQSHSDYWYIAERLRNVLFEGPFDPATLHIKLHYRKARRDGAYSYPGGMAAWLLPLNDLETGHPRRPPVRAHRETSEGFEAPRLQIWRENGWAYIRSLENPRSGSPWAIIQLKVQDDRAPPD